MWYPKSHYVQQFVGKKTPQVKASLLKPAEDKYYPCTLSVFPCIRTSDILNGRTLRLQPTLGLELATSANVVVVIPALQVAEVPTLQTCLRAHSPFPCFSFWMVFLT